MVHSPKRSEDTRLVADTLCHFPTSSRKSHRVVCDTYGWYVSTIDAMHGRGNHCAYSRHRKTHPWLLHSSNGITPFGIKESTNQK